MSDGSSTSNDCRGPEGLLIVVINYRTPDLTVKCLASLAAELPSVPGMRTVVVDNCSGDGSPASLREAIGRHAWDSWCDLLELQENLGFAGGNNAGIRWAWQKDKERGQDRRALVLALNSDTIVHPGCLAHCVQLMEQHRDVGAMSCRLLNLDGSLQVVARKFPSPLRLIAGVTGLPWKAPILFGWGQTEYRDWDMERKAGDPDWIGGAFMLVRTEVLDRVGALDEEFFFYGEDVEFCFRVARGGWRVHYDPSVTTTHLGGSSSDPTRMASDARVRAVWRARYLFVRKCYGRAAMWAVRATDAAGLVVRRAALGLSGRGATSKANELRQAQRVVFHQLGSL